MFGTIGTRGTIPIILATHDSHLVAPTNHVVQPLFDAPETDHPSMLAISFSVKNS